MALSNLTKVQTLGIGSNIEVVGVITTGQFKSGTSNLHSTGVDLTNLNVSGIATIGGNLSVGGVLTYEDVTNIDSVGVVTAREGIFIPDNKKIHLGNASGSGDLQIYHTGAHSYIADEGVGELIISGSRVQLMNAARSGKLLDSVEGASGYLRLYQNNNIRLEATNTGATITGDITISDSIIHSGDNSKIRFPANDTISFETSGNEGVRIDAGGRLLVGTNTARTFGGGEYAHLQVEGTTQSGAQITITRNTNDTYSSNLSLVKTRGTSDGAVTTVQDDDNLGTIQFRGADGSDVFAVASSIHSEVDGSPSDGTDMPGALVFATTADGAASPTERMRIASNGKIHMNYADGNGADRLNIMGGGDGITIARSTANASDGNILGNISFHSYMNGSYHANAEAKIEAIADSGQSGSSAPTHLDFYTKKTGVGPGASPAQQMRIWSGGNVQIYDGDLVVGTSGHGINFAAAGTDADSTGASTNSEVLDDYEEGSWVPLLKRLSGGVESGFYNQNTQNGHYTKIGNTVFIRGRVHWSGGSTGSGQTILVNLPFAAENTGSNETPLSIGYRSGWNYPRLAAYLQVTNGRRYIIQFVDSSGTYGTFDITPSATASSGHFYFSGQYQTTS